MIPLNGRGGEEVTEVISDARRSRSWAKNESSSSVRDMWMIAPVKVFSFVYCDRAHSPIINFPDVRVTRA